VRQSSLLPLIDRWLLDCSGWEESFFAVVDGWILNVPISVLLLRPNEYSNLNIEDHLFHL
jgi:hypothetical protein